MSCMLVKELQKIDRRLKSLKPGQVIDCSILNENFGISLSNYYREKYNVLGPFTDNAHPGKYAVAFSLKPGRVQNA